MFGRILCWLGIHKSGEPRTFTIWDGPVRNRTIVVDGAKVKYCPRCSSVFGVGVDGGNK